MIDLDQTRAWHPCHRQPGERYDDANLEKLFAGEPASWPRVASWDIPRADVIWLATRVGAMGLTRRWVLLDRIAKEADSDLVNDARGEMLVAVAQARVWKEEERQQWARARAWRDNHDVGWTEVHQAKARAAAFSSRACDLDAAAWAWEAAIVAECCGVSWDRQVELLLDHD